MLGSPPQSMDFHVLGRQLDELLTSLPAPNSVHYDIFVTCFVFYWLSCISVGNKLTIATKGVQVNYH